MRRFFAFLLPLFLLASPSVASDSMPEKLASINAEIVEEVERFRDAFGEDSENLNDALDSIQELARREYVGGFGERLGGYLKARREYHRAMSRLAGQIARPEIGDGMDAGDVLRGIAYMGSDVPEPKTSYIVLSRLEGAYRLVSMNNRSAGVLDGASYYARRRVVERLTDAYRSSYVLHGSDVARFENMISEGWFQ